MEVEINRLQEFHKSLKPEMSNKMKTKNRNLKSLYLFLITALLMSVLALPVCAQEIGVKVENGVKKEGVTIRPDQNSPTGFTATFVYKNATAKSVQFYGQFQFAKPNQQYPLTTVTTSTPEQWTKDMFPLNYFNFVLLCFNKA